MKKFNLSLVAVLAMSTFAVAGGDIAPVEPVVDVPVIVEESMGNFYLGLAYGSLNAEVEDRIDLSVGGVIKNSIIDESFDEIMIQAGYKFNQYVAVEGRYWFGMENSINDWQFDKDSNDVTFDAWGIYVKPMYPMTPAFNIYAMLGYAGADMEVHSIGYLSDSVDGFSWGLGADYAFSNNVSVFIDYVSIYSDDEKYSLGLQTGTLDYSIDTVNFGVTYNF